MNIKTKVRKIGNSQGILLPKEALQQLQVKEGDAIYLTKAPDNALRISTGDPAFERKMAIADDLMNRYQNALRELAK
ncbi:MAG: AbrB/MazE/SpoVT family DNA-binding domain-containing protein [Kiritimatiellae bacterium]|nr:AbrB/MazE/SpoVT family DNA-binding domain-containing protein [Kiritimatiellia bacterium]